MLFFIDSLGSGGAQRQMVELAIGFHEKNHEVFFLTYHHLNFFRQQLDDYGINVTTIEEPRYLRRIWKIRKFIRNSGCHSVIAYLSGPCFISAIAGLPFRDWKLIVGERSSNPKILTSIRWRGYRILHLLADKVVANSFQNLRLVKEAMPLLPGQKCKVIYNLVDLERFKPAQGYRFLCGDRLNLLVPSSHQYLKNLKGLVEAVSGLTILERKKLSVHWYGDVLDDSFDEGERLIASYGVSDVFSFYPPTAFIHERMATCDAVGLFSFYEGLPNAVCEGMSCGKPVIASDVSDNSLLLDDADGLLFDPKDSLSISAALRHLLSLGPSQLRSIGERNRKRAEFLFNKDSIVSEYLNLLG